MFLLINISHLEAILIHDGIVCIWEVKELVHDVIGGKLLLLSLFKFIWYVHFLIRPFIIQILLLAPE